MFLYLVTKPSPADFRAFLLRHTELLRALYDWTIRLLVPRHLAKSAAAYQYAARDHLATRLEPSDASELTWFFHERRRLAETASGSTDRRFRQAARTFGAPRFSALHRAWLEEGDHVIRRAESGVLPDAVERGKGHLECVVLSRQYLHLSALVGVA